jgi:hypothetical protein
MGCYAAVDAAPRSLNWRNSASGIVNSVTPQSKQTAIFGNTITGGLSRFLMPEKWMMISEPNCAWLFDEHDRQDINTAFVRPAILAEFDITNDTR